MKGSNINEKILSLIAVLYSGKALSDKASAIQNLGWPAMAGTVENAGMAGYFSDLLLQTDTEDLLVAIFQVYLHVAEPRNHLRPFKVDFILLF